MYKFHCLNPIAEVGLSQFTGEYEAEGTLEGVDAVLVRSAAMHELEFDKALKVIARAGAGVNNIPLDRCAEEGIVVFNTPGANANGVKELVIAGMLLASRDIIGESTGCRSTKKTVMWQNMRRNKKGICGLRIGRKETWSDRSWRNWCSRCKRSSSSWHGCIRL